MIRNLDTALLRSFVTVADAGGMTAAARSRHMTQGAVSQQIKRLEEALGETLFVRGRGGLRLTAAGERLIGKARRLLALNDEIVADMAAGALAGTVRLGVPYDLVGTCLMPAIRGFAEACPQVELSLTCGSSPDLAGRLAAGELDVAVLEEPIGKAGGECLGFERLVWVGARAGAAHRARPLPISMVMETCAFRPVVLAALQRRDLPWRTVFENGGIEATAATVRADLAVTAWLAATVPADLQILGVESGLPELPSFAIGLHVAPHATGAAVEELVRGLREGLARSRAA